MRKHTLFARRLRGDIGPLGIDPVRGLMSRIIAPAVSLTGVYQDYDQEDVTQNFTIGSRMQVDDRVFYYSQAVAALVYPIQYHLLVSTDQVLADNDCLSTAATLATGTQIIVDATDYEAGSGGDLDEDELVGGYVELNYGGTLYAWRRIVANTVGTAAHLVTITVDRPFNIIFPATTQVSIHKSIYRHVDNPAHAGLGAYGVAVGVPPIEVQANYFFWLQTYGPCWIGPTGAFPLSVANQYDVYFNYADGSTNSSLAAAIGTDPSPQRIGHVMGAGAYGSGAVFLELAA